MEIATPKMENIISFINKFSNSSYQSLLEKCADLKSNVSGILNSYAFRFPLNMVRNKSQRLDNNIYKMIRGFDNYIKIKQGKVNLLAKTIETHNIQKTLKKGFVLVRQDSKFVTRSSGFNKDKPAILKFYDNELTVLKKK